MTRESRILAEYDGVGGWLLLFCASLALFRPIMFGMRAGIYYTDLQQLNQEGNIALVVIGLFIVLLDFGLVVFSVFTGVALWRIRPYAVTSAKIFLICELIFGLMITALLSQWLPMLQGVAYFIIWYTYLNRSGRVKSTYGLEEKRGKQLPEVVTCPFCKEEVQLENNERESREFTCPLCSKYVIWD